jgi:alanyl-tRNA synthetase
MGGDYKELKVNQLRIETLILQEEESFLHTMQRGGNLLQKMIEQSQGTLSGNDCFKLKDTYGFPFEEIELIAKDYDLKVDTKGFLELEQQAKELSKGAHKTTRQLANPTYYNEYLQLHGTTTFLGYARLECQSIVQAILVDNEPTSTLKTEQKGLLLLDQTCFYAEMGGQIGDLGTIEVENGLFVVEDTIAPINGLIAHVGFVKQGSIQIKQTARAKVDQNKRSNTEKNHTATHLLHYALCHLLGEHIKQAGSYVGSTHLRFDFSHPKPLSRKELLAIENMVNEKIISNLKVETFETPFEKVKHNSKIKQFFGEKYSKYVRVVDIDFSKELCGGTHVDHLGKIGFFKITKETSIGQGLRRIEAVTAMEAVHVCHFYEEKLLQLSEKLNAPIDTLIEKVEHLQIEKKEIEQNLKQLEKQKIEHLATQLLEKENKCLFEVVDVEKKQLIPLVDLLFSKANSLICCLARIDGEMVQIVIKLSKDHLKQLSAKTLLQKAFEISKGRGGGSDQLAQGTLESAKAINDVLKSLKEHVLKLC